MTDNVISQNTDLSPQSSSFYAWFKTWPQKRSGNTECLQFTAKTTVTSLCWPTSPWKKPTFQISVSFVARYTCDIRQLISEDSYMVREICKQMSTIGIDRLRNQKQVRNLWFNGISVDWRVWEAPRKQTIRNKCQEYNHFTLWQGTTIAPCLIHKMWQF